MEGIQEASDKKVNASATVTVTPFPLSLTALALFAVVHRASRRLFAKQATVCTWRARFSSVESLLFR
jgi:hypothetical protein